MSTLAALSIDTLLAEERALVRAVLEALRAERQCLASVDADRLAEQAARKSGLFEQLTDAARRRQVALSTLGFTPDRPGMEAWIACQPNASSLQKEWQGLREDLEAAQDINRANGQLIEEHSRVNRQALGVLLQGSGRGVYGPDGRTSGLGTGRRLGSA